MSPVYEGDAINGLGHDQADVEPVEPKIGDDSSDTDSDLSDDEDHERKVSVKALLKDVLRSIRDDKLDLTQADQYEQFVKYDGQHLASQTGDEDQPTVLHIIASKDKKELPKFDRRLEPLIQFLAKQKDYLTIQNRSYHTSLFLAIEAKKKEMVQWMCSAHPDISTILSITGSRGMNCLHAGINKRVRFLGLLIDKAHPVSLAAKDTEGNTPLHLAVEYKKCKRDQLDVVKKMVDKGDCAVLAGGPSNDFNNDGLSPYLHHIKSVEKAQERNRKKAREEVECEKTNSRFLDSGAADKPNREKGPRYRDISTPGPPPVPMGDSATHPERRINPQLDHLSKYGGSNTDQAPNTVRSPVVAVAPDLLGSDDKKRFSRGSDSVNYQKKEQSSSKSSSRVDDTTVENVGRFLKLHYLRSRSHSEAMEILYGQDTTAGKWALQIS